jgi:probable O-glycosylation ligase (exosortase A-associated)
MIDRDPTATHGIPSGPGLRESDILARSARRAAIIVGVIVFCALVGLAAIIVRPVIIIGAVAGIGAVIAILARPYLGLLLYTAVDLLRPGELYPALAAMRLERTVAVVALGSMYFDMYRREGKLLFDRSPQTRWFLAFLGAVACSVPWSYWTVFSMNVFVDLLKLLAYYLMIAHMANTRTRMRAWVWTYLLFIGYFGVSSLRAYYAGNYMFAQGIERVEGLTSLGTDPNTLATTLGSALGLFLLAGLRDRARLGRLLSLAGVVMILWTISFTGSRGGVVALLAMLGWLWWNLPRRLLTGVVGVVLLVGIFQALPEQYQQRYASIGKSERDESSENRIDAWKKGARMVADRPFFGVGAGCFGFAHADHYSSGRVKSYLNAHNLVVQLFAETGVIGGVTFFGFVIAFIIVNRRAARVFRGRGSEWRFEAGVADGIMAGIVFLFAASIFGHSLYRSTWYIFAAAGLALHRLSVVTADSPGVGPAKALPSGDGDAV